LYKVIVENLPAKVSWQDLKDWFKNNSGPDVKFTDVRDGKGMVGFETREQAEAAIEGMNNTAMKNKEGEESTVTMTLEEPATRAEPVSRDEGRSDEAAVESRDEEGRHRSRSMSRGSPRYDE
jgi:hypothetical protein